MKKWVISLIILIVVIIIIVLGVKSSHKAKPQELLSVTRGSITEQATAVGSIVPDNTTTVKSQVEGNVSHIYYNSGDYVHKGDTLMRLKPNPAPLSIAQYVAQVDQYKAKVVSDKEVLKNLKMLLDKGVISKNYSAYSSAVAQLKADQAALDFNQQNLDILRKGQAVIAGEKMESDIKSPINGYILQRNVDLGDPVTPMAGYQNATILYTIADMDRPIFQGTVDEIDAGKIKLKMPVNIVVGALPKVILQGTLTRFSLQSDNQNNIINQKNGMLTPTSSTSAASGPFNVGFQVKVQDFNVPKGVDLRSGYSATAEIIIRTLKNILVLPERALVFKEGKVYVHLPKLDPKTNMPVTKEVKIGVSDGMNVQILDGLSEGDKVLVLEDEGANNAA